MRHAFTRLLGWLVAAGCGPVFLGLSSGQGIPEDLLEDEHVREEFGVNSFTTPSIKKIFEDLDTLRPLPYEKLKREIPKEIPKDRTRLALALGGLIADGFLIVESEKLYELEALGRALWDHAQVLGAGTRLSRHTKSLLEHLALEEWEALKTELAKTQKDVEAEMVLLRDVDVAHLISLGGWLRAFEIGCVAALDPYDGRKAKVLGRYDVADYFYQSMQTLDRPLLAKPHIQELTRGLAEIREMLDVPETKVFTEDEVVAMLAKVEKLLSIVEETGPAPVKEEPQPVGAISQEAAPVVAEGRGD